MIHEVVGQYRITTWQNRRQKEEKKKKTKKFLRNFSYRRVPDDPLGHHHPGRAETRLGYNGMFFRWTFFSFFFATGLCFSTIQRNRGKHERTYLERSASDKRCIWIWFCMIKYTFYEQLKICLLCRLSGACGSEFIGRRGQSNFVL